MPPRLPCVMPAWASGGDAEREDLSLSAPASSGCIRGPLGSDVKAANSSAAVVAMVELMLVMQSMVWDQSI